MSSSIGRFLSGSEGCKSLVALAPHAWHEDVAASCAPRSPPRKMYSWISRSPRKARETCYGLSPYIVAGDAPSSAFGVGIAFRCGIPAQQTYLCVCHSSDRHM